MNNVRAHAKMGFKFGKKFGRRDNYVLFIFVFIILRIFCPS